MKTLTVVTLIGSIAVGLSARADFRIGPTEADTASTMPGSSRPIVLSPEGSPPTRRQPLQVAPAAAIPIAQGFGKGVPLAFASRQIVPAKVKVTFGPGVDQAALVDWKGGRAWVETLRSVVRPLGLRVVVRWMAVSIIRA